MKDQSKARYHIIDGDKNQDIYILSLGIKQESRMIILDFPLRVKNQELGRNQDILYPHLDGKQELRNEIQDS